MEPDQEVAGIGHDQKGHWGYFVTYYAMVVSFTE